MKVFFSLEKACTVYYTVPLHHKQSLLTDSPNVFVVRLLFRDTGDPVPGTAAENQLASTVEHIAMGSVVVEVVDAAGQVTLYSFNTTVMNQSSFLLEHRQLQTQNASKTAFARHLLAWMTRAALHCRHPLQSLYLHRT